MEKMQKLLQVLKELRPDVDFEQEEKLIDDGTLDSFDIITLVGELNETFAVDIGVDDLQPENFNSAQAMLELINKLEE